MCFNSENFLIKEMGGSYVLWVAETHRYLRLEEPVYWLIQQFMDNKNEKEIIRLCQYKYGIIEKQSINFISSVKAYLNSHILSEKTLVIKKVLSEKAKSKTFVASQNKRYSIYGETFLFRFENKYLEYLFHPILSHLETVEQKQEEELFELYSYYGKLVFRQNSTLIGIWNKNESHLLKGQVFLKLFNTVFQKKENDWLALIHASAVCDGKNTIVFPAESGVGKSTLAALLNAHGLSFVSDDLLPVGFKDKKSYPFPAAISVKHGAVEALSNYFPDVIHKKEFQYPKQGKTVRYIPPLVYRNNPAICPVKAIVFVNYTPVVDLRLEKIDVIDAVSDLLDKIWLPRGIVFARSLLEWLDELPCYRMNYSDNNVAVRTIKKLFKDDIIG